MSVHHIICESDTAHVCPYCGRSADSRKWHSVFDNSNFHYKSHRCECGRNLSVKMNFIGSGQDNWAKGLDSKILEADLKSQKK